MNAIWITLMIISFVCLLITRPDTILSTMLSSSSSALTLCLNLCSMYAVWLGMFEILDKSGATEKLAKLFRPITKKLFRTDNPYAQQQLSLNIAANVLGLGSAATPAGIEAMKEMDDGSGKATFGMIMLFIINATSIQLLPTTAISLRLAAGSQNAADIIFPTILSTILTTGLGIVFVFLIEKLKRQRRKK